ncbi:hypothetical protein Vretimale_12175 [Volvox reticuliferus]|uniref:Uncharacterized protein n=1 Tax=Volvox reticuliferus TaxID=1737510 RepID=A0A8J4GHZ4_9CHLO|nr:hypothetical protein Vretimale_12175 [Volvox reticuliferus]
MAFLAAENRRQHHVGLEKYKIVHHDFNHFTLGPSKGKSSANKMAFTLVEPEQFQPSFNVLYVRTQRPTVLRTPLVQVFLDTWAEAVELVRPVFRFGIPESSLKDKCKYWRDDGSSLPTTPSLQTQRLIKAISNEAFGTSRLNRHHPQQPTALQQQPTALQQQPTALQQHQEHDVAKEGITGSGGANSHGGGVRKENTT